MEENLTIHEAYAKENGNISINAIFDPEKMQLQSGGLTKREYFAGLAMQSMLSGRQTAISRYIPEDVVKTSLQYADELLKQLEKTK